MSFPLVWPNVTNGTGRLLEVSVQYGDDVQDPSSKQHVPRQCLTGPDPTKETNTIIRFADWISSSEYNAYLSSAARPQADKDGVTHLIDICEGPSTTPLAAWYLFSGMRCPKKNQAALAAGLDAYLRGIFHCGTFAPVFHHVGVSQSDPELIISVQGWPSREAADEYWHSEIHWAFYPAVKDLMVVDLGPFQCELSEK